MPRIQVDMQELFRMWHDRTLTRREIALALGVSQSFLSTTAARLGLPRRETVHSEANDPTPEEIARRAQECRERHFRERREETPKASRARAWRQELTRLP